MADPPRPHMSHTLSGLLRFHRRSTVSGEQEPLLASATPSPRQSLTAPNITLPDPNNTAEEVHRSDLEDDEEEHADSDGLYPPHSCWTSVQGRTKAARERADPFKTRDCAVYVNIHRVRRDIINSIDDPYSLDQLKAPRMNVSVIRPLVLAYYESQDLSMIYCLLVNRMQFIREKSSQTHHQTVNLTRALLCELIAERILRKYNEHNPGPKGLLKLATILVHGFDAFQNAPDEVIREVQDVHGINYLIRENSLGNDDGKMTALEIAIISESKSFLASSACQKVVDAIYRGKVVYSPNSFIDIIPDRWKKRPISLYDPRKGPILNQHRLIVPRTRNALEIFHFMVLLGLYIATMVKRETRNTTKFEIVEAVFQIYGTGWVLDQLACMLEHGWQVYTQNLWAFLDVMFSGLFLTYLIMRLHALRIKDDADSRQLARTSLDVLSCAAPVLIPRLAFNFMSENMLFVSLRAMMSDFLTLTALAVWSFGGFLLSLKWLHNGLHQSITIGKWMVWIWFGLDGTGINESPDFHWFLGPTLMVLFAFLGNTLFLTILVSMLTNTFSIIVKNAVQEIQFRRAVLTFEGVKSDAIFAYQPPLNVLALVVMLPLKAVVSPRVFHKINVGAVRVLNFPVLILIGLYERRTLWVPDKHAHHRVKIDWTNPFGPRKSGKSLWSSVRSFLDFSLFSVHGDIAAVFDIDPPQSVLDEIAKDEDDEGGQGLGKTINERFQKQFIVNDSHEMAHQDSSGAMSFQPRPRFGSRRHTKPRKSTLAEEFADSESGSDAEHERDHPKGHRKPRKTQRIDSLVELDDPQAGMHEANARLHKMERAMERLEALVTQLAQAQDDGDNESDNESEQGELLQDMRGNTMQ